MKISNGVSRRIIKIERRFLWGWSKWSIKISRVQLSDVCKLKSEEGLGSRALSKVG